jgi:hypothetical protein
MVADRLPGMAARGWGSSIALAVGVAAGSAAAQLGIGYGLGVITWTSATDPAGERSWLAALAWTTWIAATATVLGAVAADRFSFGELAGAPPRRVPGGQLPGPVATSAWRLVIGLTAAVGGLLTVPLVAIPARAAHRPDTLNPQLIAGGYAIVGVVLGLLVAIAALSSRAVAANAIATSGWVWLLAVVSVIHSSAARPGQSTAQLDLWRFGPGHFLRQTLSLPGAALMMGAALVIGALAAWPAARRADPRVGVAISGGVGPLLIAAAYFMSAPKLIGAQPDEQLSAYLIAPYAVLAGLAGSVLLSAVIAQRGQRAAAIALPAQATPATAVDAGPGPTPTEESDPALDPTDDPDDAIEPDLTGGAEATSGSDRTASTGRNARAGKPTSTDTTNDGPTEAMTTSVGTTRTAAKKRTTGGAPTTR